MKMTGEMMRPQREGGSSRPLPQPRRGVVVARSRRMRRRRRRCFPVHRPRRVRYSDSSRPPLTRGGEMEKDEAEEDDDAVLLIPPRFFLGPLRNFSTHPVVARALSRPFYTSLDAIVLPSRVTSWRVLSSDALHVNCSKLALRRLVVCPSGALSPLPVSLSLSFLLQNEA